MTKQHKEKGSHREQEKREKSLTFHFSSLSHAYFFTEVVALTVPKKTHPQKRENKHDQVPK